MSSMKVPKREPGQTRSQLLEAAIHIFSRKGFRDATVAEICKEAHANIAAINYHFRDKESLYVEAWRVAFHRSLETHPTGGGVPVTADPVERLRGFILALISRAIDPQNRSFDIMHKELVNPTGFLAQAMRNAIEPIRTALSDILRKLLGNKVAEDQVRLCQMSIMAQCLHLRMAARRWVMVSPGNAPAPLEFDVATLAEHVTQFSLAGLRAIRQQAERAEGAA